MDEVMVKRLVGLIQGGLQGGQPAAKAQLRLIVPESARDPNALSESERAVKLRLSKFVADRYMIPWLIDQVALGRPLEALPDADVIRLYEQAKKALKCVKEGVSFDDAGLVDWGD